MPKHPLVDEYLTPDLPLDQPITATEKRYARNLHPRISATYRLALIGEAPGAEELREGTPFVGQSGRLLDQLMSKAGIIRDSVFLGNICETRPFVGPDGSFPRTGNDVESGLLSLSRDLESFKPNICLLLGGSALYHANGEDKLGSWRGSYFIGSKPGPFWGRKCIASYNPAACLKQYEFTPLLMFDIKKALREAFKPDIIFPQRQLIIDHDLHDILSRLNTIKTLKQKVSVDIEGGVGTMSCMSFATGAQYSFIVPFYGWGLDEECAIWRAVSDVLEDPEIPKVFQNALYDTFVLQYSYNIVVRGLADDTMVKHWEKYCELEKNLGFLCSLYTNEPYYKEDRKSDDRDVFYEYCCRDSAVTYEINEVLEKALDPGQKAHYRFNMELLQVFRFMQYQGMPYDKAEADRRKEECELMIARLQSELDHLTGHGIPANATKGDLLQILQSTMCYKRNVNQIKKGYEHVYQLLRTALLQPGDLTPEQLGRFSIECDLSLNIRSNKFKSYVYQTLKLPPQYDPKSGALTTDNEALLILHKKTNNPIIKLAVEIGLLRTRAGKKMLGVLTDPDGRIRCGYNLVGADTGRISCYTSNTGSGANLQTFPNEDPLKPVGHPLRKGMRDLILAEPGYYLLKCDLKGADGWTVGANCKSLGDPTMFDDLIFGIKPAQVLAFMMRHGHSPLLGKNRYEVKDLVKEVKKDDWDYFACKQCIWGFCYLMGPRKAASHIFELSEGSVNLSEGDMRELRRLLFLRYRVTIWHDALSHRLSAKPEMVVASGHKRRFFGRYNEILGKALAHEPQANTTYATNKAAWRLWRDPENTLVQETGTSLVEEVAERGPDSNGASTVCRRKTLRLRPVHQVHDELLTTCKIEDIEWAKAKVKEYFNNPMIIAGIKVTIPFDGSYGTNWAMDDQSKVGDI